MAELEESVASLQAEVDDATRRISAPKAERAASDRARADELRAELALLESALPADSNRAASDAKLGARCRIVENELEFARSAIAGRIERRLQPVRDQVQGLGGLLQREIAALNRVREADGSPLFSVPTDGDIARSSASEAAARSRTSLHSSSCTTMRSPSDCEAKNVLKRLWGRNGSTARRCFVAILWFTRPHRREWLDVVSRIHL
jgi:hypothetical protein